MEKGETPKGNAPLVPSLGATRGEAGGCHRIGNAKENARKILIHSQVCTNGLAGHPFRKAKEVQCPAGLFVDSLLWNLTPDQGLQH